MSERVSLGSTLPYFFEMAMNTVAPLESDKKPKSPNYQAYGTFIDQEGVYYLEGMDLLQPTDTDLPHSD